MDKTWARQVNERGLVSGRGPSHKTQQARLEERTGMQEWYEKAQKGKQMTATTRDVLLMKLCTTYKKLLPSSLPLLLFHLHSQNHYYLLVLVATASILDHVDDTCEYHSLVFPTANTMGHVCYLHVSCCT